jgi:Zn ribbon nucleic-acid-binding protein
MTCLSCGYPQAQRTIRPSRKVIEVTCPRCSHTSTIQMKGRPKVNETLSEEPITCRS